MGVAINGAKSDIAINNKSGLGAAYNGMKILPDDRAGYYIANFINDGLSSVGIYENNNGVKGALVETIKVANGNHWERLLYYSPEIAIMENRVAYM